MATLLEIKRNFFNFNFNKQGLLQNPIPGNIIYPSCSKLLFIHVTANVIFAVVLVLTFQNRKTRILSAKKILTVFLIMKKV